MNTFSDDQERLQRAGRFWASIGIVFVAGMAMLLLVLNCRHNERMAEMKETIQQIRGRP